MRLIAILLISLTAFSVGCRKKDNPAPASLLNPIDPVQVITTNTVKVRGYRYRINQVQFESMNGTLLAYTTFDSTGIYRGQLRISLYPEPTTDEERVVVKGGNAIALFGFSWDGISYMSGNYGDNGDRIKYSVAADGKRKLSFKLRLIAASGNGLSTSPDIEGEISE